MLSTDRGTTAFAAVGNTVTGPTAGVEPFESNGMANFFTLPLAADITISGTITLNLWGFESNMSANVAINARIDRIDKLGAYVSTIATTARTSEMAVTTSAVNNFTVTPTSTDMLKGERLRVVVFGDDSTSNMATGFTFQFNYNAASAAATGDSWIRFTENLTFLTTEPAGTILYPTWTTVSQTPLPVGAGSTVEYNLSRTRGSGAVAATYVTSAGWQAPQQAQTAGSNPAEWYSPRLEAFTLSGLVRFNIWSHEGVSTAEIGLRVELAVCDADGSNVTVYGANTVVDTATPGGAVGSGTSIIGELTTASAIVKAWVAGSDISVANGQRLRVRVYADNNSQNPWPGVATFNATMGGTTGAANGDSWIQLGQTVTDYTLPSIGYVNYRFYDEGSEAASVARWLESYPTVVPHGSDTILLLRMQVAVPNAGSADVAADDYSLQFQKNSNTGSWTTVAASADVEPYDSASLTNDAATTQRLGTSGVTGSFVAGKVCEDGTVALGTFARNTYTELLFAVKVRGSVLAEDDIIYFRLTKSDLTTVLNGVVGGTTNCALRVAALTVSADRLWIQSSGSLPSPSTETHRGTNTNNLAGSGIGWWPSVLWPYQGKSDFATSAIGTTSVAGPTAGIEWAASAGTAHEFISPPLANDITIAGDITFNLWGRQNGDANAAINCYLDRVGPDGAILSRIVTTARTTELNNSATVHTVNNFTATPTSTAMQKGDRIRAVIFFDDAGSNMIASVNLQFTYEIKTPGVAGDSWIEFTESLDFSFDEPAGSKYYLTDTSLPGVGSNTPLSLLTTRGGGVTNRTVATTTGWTAPIQLSNGAGGFVEWFTPQLTAFTLAGFVTVRVPGKYTSQSASLRAEIAIVNSDGTGAAVWGSAILTGPIGPRSFQGILNLLYQGNISTVETSRMSHIAGQDTAVAAGKRLRLRVLIDDERHTAMVTGGTITVYYAGTTAEASGDAFIILPQTVTESAGQPTTPPAPGASLAFKRRYFLRR